MLRELDWIGPRGWPEANRFSETAQVITKRNSDWKSLNQGKPNPWTPFSAKKLLKDRHLENRGMNQKKEFRNEDAAVK